MEYVVCPFCGWNRPRDNPRFADGEYRFYVIEGSASDNEILQVRQVSGGPGRGRKEKGVGGFKLVEAYSIEEALESEEYRELAEHIRDRMVRILRDWIEAGIIDGSEVLAQHPKQG